MYKIEYKQFTNIGSRDANEDRLLVYEQDNTLLVALADGMGGHMHGDVAAQLACEKARDHFAEGKINSADVFGTVYDECQNAIREYQKSRDCEMGTTLNLLYISDGVAKWSHVGDSRTYYFKNKKYIKRTFDHSLAQYLVNIGEIEEEEIRFHSSRNQIMRALGFSSESILYSEEEPVKLEGNQQFLLCTDGFWEMITEEQMENFLEVSESAEEWIEKMSDFVLEKGSETELDNVSAIAIWIK